VLEHHGAQRLEVGGAAAVVDVQPVRRVADRDDLGAEPAQRGGRGDGGRSVRRVHHHLEAVEPVGHGADEVVHVALDPVGEVGDPPDARAHRTLPGLLEPRLDGVLDLVVQLVAAAREELDPVVLGRVVARREHHAEVGLEHDGQVGHRGRRQHAEAHHVHPGRGEPRRHRRLEELARGARVTADDRLRPVPGELAALAQHMRRGDREVEREFGGDLAVRQPAHPVGSEKSGHGCGPLSCRWLSW
jgi:hypothetical protein